MSLTGWLSRLKQHLGSAPRARRRYTSPLSPYGLRDWVLEDRCLPSSGPFPMPLPNPNPNTNLSSVLFIGGTGADGKNYPAAPAKFVTIQNDSSQLIYPYFRDANSGKEPASGNYYDPADHINQEYRAYIGWQDTSGKNWLGVPAGASITVKVPLVFWDGANIYYVTDGQNLTSVGPPNIYGYNTASTRYLATGNAPTAGGIQWVPSFTPPANNSVNAKYGQVLFYHDTTAGTALPASSSQLTEFTIRDKYLSNFGITSDQAHELINYDISYVDSAILPIAMEATNVPIPNSNPLTNADFGWAGSTLDYTAMQSALQQFTSNSSGELGSYFAPLGSTANGPGWPYFFNTDLANFGLKIPGGANIFAESPLNNVRSKYDPTNDTWALSSGGFDPIFVSQATAAGGQSGTTVSLTFPNQTARDFYVNTINTWLANGEKPITATYNAGANTLGNVTAAANGGTSTSATITLSQSVSIPSPISVDSTRPVTDYAASRIRDLFYAWASYYVKQYQNFAGASYAGTITPQVINPQTSRNNRLVLNQVPTDLNLGMTVTGNGIQPGSTILRIDPVHKNWIYLSQNATAGASGTYQFTKPQTMPYANEPGITPINLQFAAGPATDTAKAFAASVYEAMIVESQVTDFPPTPTLPKSMVLMVNVIGADFNLLRADPTLGGQLRDIIKSILRGVPDFTLQPDESKWYPPPADHTGGQNFNVYNLDPYVWFIHQPLGMSAYGFSVDDDAGDINADNTNALTYVVSGIAGLTNKNEWKPSLHWGLQLAMAQLLAPTTVTTAFGPVTGNAINLQNNAQYWQIGFDDPNNSVVGAYVTGPGIPAGARVVAQGPTNVLQLILSTSDAVPTKGPVRLIFTGKPNTASNVFNDNFDRANDNTGLGPNWNTQSGTMGIQNKQAVVLKPGQYQAYYSGNSSLTDLAVSAVVSLAPSGDSYAGVFGRSDGNNNTYVGILFKTAASGSGVELARYTPNTYTNGFTFLKQVFFTSTPITTADLQLEIIGTGNHTSLQLYVNDALTLSWTEGDPVVSPPSGNFFPIAGGSAGLFSSGAAGAAFTNFSIFSLLKPALLGIGNDANTSFVDNVYQVLLGRPADGGAEYWVDQLDAGMPPSAVIQGIEASPEYLDDLVNNLYEQYLQRAADPAGLGNWVGLLQNGGTIEQVISGIVSSSEYYASQGSTNIGYVPSLYTNILGRTGSTTEVEGWVDQMARGLTAAQVADDFLSSLEYRTNLVVPYYQTYLGRPADPLGLVQGYTQLSQGVHDQVVLAAILGSPEGFGDYSQPPPTPGANDANTNYVDYLYQSLLGRPADAGADYWINLLDSGTSASAVVQGIAAGTEYLDNLVNNLYEQDLGRAADPAGLSSWVGLLQNGGTIEQVISGIVSSPEYYASQGGTNSAYVASLYTNILNRIGSSTEIQGWVNQMAGGLTAAQVANDFLSSLEYRTNLVESYYQTYLGRPADSAGLTNWLDQLNQGIHDQVVLAAILGSPEGFGLYS